MCCEVLLTCWAYYAQAIEGLPCYDNSYTIDKEGKKWFKKNMSLEERIDSLTMKVENNRWAV